MSAKLTSSLPNGEGNGLDVLIRDLVGDPHRLHVVIGIVDCKKITTDNDSGEVVPTARFRRIEAVLDVEDKQVVKRLLQRALERRTGATVLPLDLEDELRAAFDDVNPQTGEMREPGSEAP